MPYRSSLWSLKDRAVLGVLVGPRIGDHDVEILGRAAERCHRLLIEGYIEAYRFELVRGDRHQRMGLVLEPDHAELRPRQAGNAETESPRTIELIGKLDVERVAVAQDVNVEIRP